MFHQIKFMRMFQQQKDKSAPTLTESYIAMRTIKQNSPEWLEARKKFVITSSEFATAIGADKTKSIRSLWKQKLLKQEPKRSNIELEALNWGLQNEVNGVKEFERLTGYITKETGLWAIFPTEFEKNNLEERLNKEKTNLEEQRPIFAASPDRLVYDEKEELIGVLEVKCPFRKQIYDCCKPNAHPDAPDERTIPLEHYIQMQGQMAAVECDVGFYCCWTPDHVTIFHVKFNHFLWKTLIEKKLQEFKNTISNVTQPGICRSKQKTRTLIEMYIKKDVKHVISDIKETNYSL